MVCRWAMRRNRANLQPSEFAGFRAGGPHPDRPVGINAPAKCAGCRCRRRVYRGNRIGTRLAQAARRRSCDASLASRQPAVRRPRGECSAAARCRWIGVRGATGSSLVRRRFIGGGACSSAGCSRALAISRSSSKTVPAAQASRNQSWAEAAAKVTARLFHTGPHHEESRATMPFRDAPILNRSRRTPCPRVCSRAHFSLARLCYHKDDCGSCRPTG